MGDRPNQEYHNTLVRRLWGNGAVRIRYLSGIFTQSGVLHVRVFDDTLTDKYGIEDLSDEEDECRKEGIAERKNESQKRLDACTREKYGGKGEIFGEDRCHDTLKIRVLVLGRIQR